MASIPSDVTLEAALYGTAHADTLLSRDKVNRLLDVLRDRRDAILDGLELELAAAVLDNQPDWVVNDCELPEWAVDTVNAMRRIECLALAIEIAEGWKASMAKRGRMYGACEHGVRLHLSGASDAVIKAAADRYGDHDDR